MFLSKNGDVPCCYRLLSASLPFLREDLSDHLLRLAKVMFGLPFPRRCGGVILPVQCIGALCTTWRPLHTTRDIVWEFTFKSSESVAFLKLFFRFRDIFGILAFAARLAGLCDVFSIPFLRC